MTTIKVWIDAEQGSIRILNDGQGIPVHVHKQEGLYLPELLFGHLLTGSNFDDSVAKVTGGRNGECNLPPHCSLRHVVALADAARRVRCQAGQHLLEGVHRGDG
jgi:DNA topoisomerase-2